MFWLFDVTLDLTDVTEFNLLELLAQNLKDWLETLK